MAISAQDKILHVANKLGLSSLKYMQASTGAIYDGSTANTDTHTFFTNSVQNANPEITNISDNRFEVNEALLIETVGFYALSGDGQTNPEKAFNLVDATPGVSPLLIVFDIVIGNKVVMKDMPIWQIGSPACFSSGGYFLKTDITPIQLQNKPRHQVYMEGVGILIPPQVEFSVNARVYDFTTNQPANLPIGCYLFGTKVNLNFNTTL